MMVIKTKKAKGTKKCVIKQNLEFKDYKNCLESNRIVNEINLQNYIGEDILLENHKEFTKDNRIILRSLQRFKSKKQFIY